MRAQKKNAHQVIKFVTNCNVANRPTFTAWHKQKQSAPMNCDNL